MSTDLFMISPLIPEISAETGVSIQRASLVTSVFAFAYMIFGPIIALVSERFTRRLAISTGVTLFGFGSLMAGFSESFSLILVGRVIAAMGASLMSAPIWAYATENAAPARTGRAVALVATVFAAGQIVGVPLSSFVASQGSWQFAFVLTGCAALLSSALILIFLKPEVRVPTRGSVQAGLIRSLRIWRKPKLVFLVLTNGLGQSSRQAPYTFAGAIMVTRFGVSIEVLGWIGAVVGIGSFLGSILAGRVIDWVRNRGIPQPLINVVSGLGMAALLPVGILGHTLALVGVAWLGVFACGSLLVSNTQEQLTRTAGEDRVYALSWSSSGMFAWLAVFTVLLSGFPVGSVGFAWAAAGIALGAAAFGGALLWMIRRE